jgi:hypothetical protein
MKTKIYKATRSCQLRYPDGRRQYLRAGEEVPQDYRVDEKRVQSSKRPHGLFALDRVVDDKPKKVKKPEADTVSKSEGFASNRTGAEPSR